jgi:cellulose synthase/poly-beta-1,6-N-acetylglucosamine synthase-like glycosyltransferase
MDSDQKILDYAEWLTVQDQQYEPDEEVSTQVLFNTQEILYYTKWLSMHARRERGQQREQAEKYAEEARKPVLFNKQEIRTFAPIKLTRSAVYTVTSQQKKVLWLLGIGYVLSLFFFSGIALQILVGIITVFYVIDLLVFFTTSLRSLDGSLAITIDDDLIHALADAEWPPYTILCPLYKETEVVPQFVAAMQALDYPTDKLQILFLTEEDDKSTRAALQNMNLQPYFDIITVPDGQPRTKPRACNFGLLQATGDYVVIYDAEDIPDPLQLKKAVLTFAQEDEKTACVQAKLNFYNAEQNLLTRWFTAEYSAWFDLILPGLQRWGMPIPLGGTSNHFPVEILREVGAWDAFNVTEDCDLGLRLAEYGLKTAILDSTTYEEANSQGKNWLHQRSRWIKGYMQTYLVHMRTPLEYLRRGRLRQFLALQFVVGGKTAILLVNPVMWMLVIIYFLLNGNASLTNAYHIVYSTPILYMGSLCLIFGNFVYTYIHLVGCFKRGQFHLVKWALFTPIYWLMGSVAAYIALYQLIFMPHYWAKTLHGLHLRKAGSL